MKWLHRFRNLFRLRTKYSPARKEVCPNCWGQQHYNGEIKNLSSREHIDLNNAKRKLGWIEAYVIKHFEGIGVKVKKGRKLSPAPREEW